tara:strand:+ start:129 stop:815 length:687 start_codon:yes stop_codon:yes gene_type:complete
VIKKFLSLVIIFIIYSSYNSASAHVLHYKNLNELVFDLYRNNQFIGQHIYLFNRDGQNLIVQNTINFEIKILGITLYKYFSKGQEQYIDGKFHSFSSMTKQNKKEKFVKIYKNEDKFFIEGSSYKGEAPKDFIIGTWWNHLIVKSNAQISAASGRIIEQNVKFIGKETIKINNEKYSALRFNFFSSDPSLSKDKKLNMDVWYDEKSLMWLKASFDKDGYWEYRLKYFE